MTRPLYSLPEGVETRWASPENPQGERGAGATANAGRKGRPCIALAAGASTTLAEVRGASGVVRRIWATIGDRSPAMLRGLRIDMFWDGASRPAVSAPFGDFFGVGLGQMAVFESALFASPEGKSFNCFVPMPFRTGMRIVVANESGKDLSALFYDVDYTVGDEHDDGVLWFHACFRREAPTTLQRDFVILPRVTGRGRYLGVNVGVQADAARYLDTWWGEGEVKVFVDGDGEHPTLAGTGTEDYVGTGWGLGRFAHSFQGAPFADRATMRYCFYRYHVPDPVWFRSDVRVTIQQIGYVISKSPDDPVYARGVPLHAAGPGLVERQRGTSGLFERQDDWSSCAYLYLDTPESELPPLAAPDLRMKGLAWGGPYLDEVEPAGEG